MEEEEGRKYVYYSAALGDFLSQQREVEIYLYNYIHLFILSADIRVRAHLEKRTSFLGQRIWKASEHNKQAAKWNSFRLAASAL